MGSTIAFAAALAALTVQPGPPATPALKPSSPWNVNYSDSMCVLAREFGEGSSKLTLIFSPGLFSEHMRVIIARLATDGRTFSGNGQLSFDQAAPMRIRFVEAFSKSNGARATVIDLKTTDLASLNTARQFQVRAGTIDAAFLPTAVPAAMKAVNKCQKELLVSWGMDAAVVASIVSFPKADGGIVRLFSVNDYPSEAVRNNKQGTSGVRFLVGKDGKVSDCRVVESSGSKLLDSQTCAVIEKRARFEPARVASGEAVESIGFQRVRWMLP